LPLLLLSTIIWLTSFQTSNLQCLVVEEKLHVWGQQKIQLQNDLSNPISNLILLENYEQIDRKTKIGKMYLRVRGEPMAGEEVAHESEEGRTNRKRCGSYRSGAAVLVCLQLRGGQIRGPRGVYGGHDLARFRLGMDLCRPRFKRF
jgi:hypothetical protein